MTLSKTLIKILPLFILLPICLFILVRPSFAGEPAPPGTLINLRDIIVADGQYSVHNSSGEVFLTELNEPGVWVQWKNEGKNSYQLIFDTGEGFGWQGENYW